MFLASNLADTRLSHARETESGAPVRDLADSNGVDAPVDAADALLAPDLHEGLHGTWGLHAGGRDLVFRDLDRLHACAEAHGGVGLRQTADHTS